MCVCVCVCVQNEVEVPNLVVKHAELEERMRDADQLLKKGDTARANKVSFTVVCTPMVLPSYHCSTCTILYTMSTTIDYGTTVHTQIS